MVTDEISVSTRRSLSSSSSNSSLSSLPLVGDAVVDNVSDTDEDNDDDALGDYTFHKLFDKYDLINIKSGYSYNINLGNVNKLLYTSRNLYDPFVLFRFLDEYTIIKYVKIIWYGSKIRDYNRYEEIINRAMCAIENAEDDLNKIESNTFDIAVNYTTNGIFLLHKVYNEEIDHIITTLNDTTYKLESMRNGVSIAFYQLLNGLGFSATINISGKAQTTYNGITKIKLYPHLISELKGNFSGYFDKRKTGIRIHQHYDLLVTLYEYLKSNPRKIKNYRVEFTIKAKNIAAAKLVAFKYCTEAKLANFFTRAGRELRYFVLPLEQYFLNIRLILNIVRNNGLSSSSSDENRLYYQNIVLYDVYNAFGMNLLFFNKKLGHIYLNNRHDNFAWFNLLTDKNGATLNMGVLNDNIRIVPVNEGSSFVPADDFFDGNYIDEEFDITDLNQSNVDEISTVIELNQQEIFNGIGAIDENENVEEIMSNIDEANVDIIKHVNITPNKYQFRYSSGKLSARFDSVMQVVQYIYSNFGSNYCSNVITTNYHVDDQVAINNNLINGYVNSQANQETITDIVDNVMFVKTNRGWRYSFSNNLACKKHYKDTKEELANIIYLQWGDSWRQHCKCIALTDNHEI